MPRSKLKRRIRQALVVGILTGLLTVTGFVSYIEFQSGTIIDPKPVVACGFGPGLSLEAAVFIPSHDS